MIQRIQTIWLILASVAAFLTLKFSFFSGNIIATEGAVPTHAFLTASSKIIILILTIAVGVAALIAVFLYKNRKLQMRISLAAMLLSLLTILLYFNEVHHFIEGQGTYDLTSLLTFVIPVLLFLAAKGIYNDQKLVKSLDRLR